MAYAKLTKTYAPNLLALTNLVLKIASQHSHLHGNILLGSSQYKYASLRANTMLQPRVINFASQVDP